MGKGVRRVISTAGTDEQTGGSFGDAPEDKGTLPVCAPNLHTRLTGKCGGPPQAGRLLKEIRHVAGRDVIAWNLFFAKQLRPTTLAWRTPAGTRWLTVPFELHDLAMPAP